MEGHAEAFAFLGGVPALVRYDNLGSAVKQVLRGRRRVETDRFVALRSHFMFESQFTLVGLEGAHEKGGIEGEVGRFRRRHLVPVPAVASLAELNARLRAGCEHDLARRITGHPGHGRRSAGRERPLLRALPGEPLQTAEQVTPRVDAKALVSVRQNRYSVPVALVGLRVTATIGAREITIAHGGRPVASHDRLVGRFGTSAQLDHYLELLARKPAALIGSVALGPGTRPRRLAGLPRRALGADRRALRPLGSRPADGRRPDARARARARPHRSSPFAARWRPARTTDAPSRSSPAERPPARRPHR